MRQLRGTELKRFLRHYRKTHPPEQRIVFVLQSVEYPVNVGSIFRIADGCGVEEVILCGITPTPPNPTIAKVARGKEQRVPWRYVEEATVALAELRDEGFRICALEIADEALPYFAYVPPQQVCLVVGHEDHGITRAHAGPLRRRCLRAHVWQGEIAERARVAGHRRLPHSLLGGEEPQMTQISPTVPLCVICVICVIGAVCCS